MRRSTLLSALLTLVCLPATALADLEITSTTFGWDPFQETITIGGPNGFPAVAANQPIQVKFNQELSSSSVNEQTVVVTSVPASVLTPLGFTSTVPGGQFAPLEYEVKGNRLTIVPKTLISGSTVSFGYAPNAYYTLELRKNPGIKGKGGDKLDDKIRINFRTTAQVTDPSAGAPKPTVKLVDPKKGTKKLSKTDPLNPKPSFDKAAPAPTPKIRIKFSELVLPSSLVNPATGVSENLRIELDDDGKSSTVTDRTLVPGQFEIKHSTTKTTAVWVSSLATIPQNSMFVVTIEPLIEDLVGNTEFSETGDIGAKRVYAFRTKPQDGPIELDPIEEEFLIDTQEDENATSADWGKKIPGILLNGAGGGTAEDGEFIPDDGPVTILMTEVFDEEIGDVVPRVYNFSSFSVPLGHVVKAMGRFPLDVRSTGPVTISGILDLSGAGGEVFDENRLEPGAGGLAELGSAAGGLGGSVTDGAPKFNPTIRNEGIAGYADSTVINKGLSGILESRTDYSLIRDGGIDFGAELDDLWIQPNTATGSDPAMYPNSTPGNLIQHNHPSFRIDEITGLDSMTVVSDELDPDFVGPMTQLGLDFYEFPPPPIVRPGDPFVVGDLAGRPGTAIGFSDTAGAGSLPLTVAQNFITQVRSGGGGGAGGRTDGSPGEDSPSFGPNEGTKGGAGGASFVTGEVTGYEGLVLSVAGTPFAGLDLSGGADPVTEPPFVVFPSLDDSRVFEIAANTDNTITITPISLVQSSGVDTNDDMIVDLDDVVDLGAGDTCRVEPNFREGGSGGGGSGVHLGNTNKLSGPPALNLPIWTPGAGGGAGGSSLFIECAKRIAVPTGGELIARGGAGGRTSGPVAASASGGGGGAGGSIVLRSADVSPFAISVEGRIDARGGLGGLGLVEGGQGGDGRVRLETIAGNLEPESLATPKVLPEIQTTDIGFLLPGMTPSVAQSEFYFTGTLTPIYDGFTITYTASKNGGDPEPFTYTLADLDGGTNPPPFVLTFNDAEINSVGGLDESTIDNDFDPDPRTLTGSWLRFRIALESEKEVDGDVFTSVAIDSVVIAVSS